MHVVRAYIVYKQRFSVVEEQHAAQPVIRAAIAYKLGTAPPIPYCDPKMMIAAADVVCDTRLRTCKDKDARFPVATDFIIDKGRPTFRPVNHYARQNALCGPARCDHAGRRSEERRVGKEWRSRWGGDRE